MINRDRKIKRVAEERRAMSNRTSLGHLLALCTIFIWGTTFISTKLILRELSPVAIFYIRFAIGWLCLLALRPRALRFGALRQELHCAGLGLSGVTLYFLTENVALQYTQAANAGLLVSASPILTTLLAHLFTRDEKLSRRLAAGFGLAFGGVFLVIFNGKLVFRLNPLGDCLALAAALFWAVYSILLKRIPADRDSLAVTCKTFFYGLLTALPALLIFPDGFKLVRPLTGLTVANLLFLGLCASLLCFVMWNKAVGIIGVVKTSNYIYLVPLIAMVTSVLVLHERINGPMLLGACLILGGIFIAERGAGGLALNKPKTGASIREWRKNQ